MEIDQSTLTDIEALSTKEKIELIVMQFGKLAILQNPPFLVADVVDVGLEYIVIRQHGNNMEYAVKCHNEAIKNKIHPGCMVVINTDLGIIDILETGSDSRVRVMEMISKPEAQFSEIGGLDSQIIELKEAVELPLLYPERFSRLGIEPPKGVLLYGPPGTGKTLLAKAVANATNVSFIHLAAPEVVQKYIGEGAKMVRDVFQMARDKAPCIIFIDEIDALAAVRTNDGTTGSAEVNRTMMQLLAEMDGFRARGNIKIIAATNRIDILDPAILRPGRFDRLIEIPLPNEAARIDILKIHTKGKQNIPDPSMIARITGGMNGAQLKAVINEAGMIRLRKDPEALNIMESDYIESVRKVNQKAQTKADVMVS
jgi:proteasome regulatory subunit